MRIKNIVLLSIAAVSVLAAQSSYDVGVSAGASTYEDADLGGALQVSLKANTLEYYGVAPRVDFEYSTIDQLGILAESSMRLAVNGVYDFDLDIPVTPYALVGFGYELLDEEQFNFVNSMFAQFGGGLKYSLNESVDLTAEAKYVVSIDNIDSYQIFAGVSLPLGDELEDDKYVEVVEEIIEYEDDSVASKNVINLEEELVQARTRRVDSDNDGILDGADSCTNTPTGYSVDANGCAREVKLAVEFAPSSTVITSSYQNSLYQFAQYLKDFPEVQVQVQGHTASDTTTTVGIVLSENRAESVKNALIELGVPASRIQAIGFGGYKPVASNSTKYGKNQNRRVEVKLFR